jgi:hypothetical protein
MVVYLIICGASPGLRLGVQRRLTPEDEQKGVHRGRIAPGGRAEDLPSAGGPASPPCLLARHRQRLCHLREGLGQLDD